MNKEVTVDKAGRIVLPKPVREELQLVPGDRLEIESSGETLTLRPVRAAAPLTKKNGIWVYRTGEPISGAEVEEILGRVRRERDEENLGH